jgi:hypothetical protein
MLRMLTDPKALQDPERLKAFRAEQERETRRRVLARLRINSMIMTGLGSVALVVGCGVAALALFSPAAINGAPPVAGLLPLGIGALFLVAGLRTAPTTSRAVLQSGVSGTAIVREVKSLTRNMGVKMPGVSATVGLVTCALTVTVQGREVDVEHREFILGSDLRYLMVGSALPIRCSNGDPSKLAIDWDALTS